MQTLDLSLISPSPKVHRTVNVRSSAVNVASSSKSGQQVIVALIMLSFVIFFV